MQIMDFLVLTLVLTLSLWGPPAVRGACVDDDETAFFDEECRTSFRFSPDHVLPPDWGVLLDSYDFSGLVGTTTVQQWRTLDVDGINEAGVSTSSPQGIVSSTFALDIVRKFILFSGVRTEVLASTA